MNKAMVLAAGVGSRLGNISLHIPKPLVPVLNKPVMAHILGRLQSQGISQVIANTHYLSDTLQNYFEQNKVPGLDLNFFHEAELSGDAGGVRACREFLQDDTFIVIMGDLITSADIGRLIAAHKEKGALATIGVKTMKDVTRFGVMKRDRNGFITAFQEKPKAGEAISNEISTGIYILEPAIFDYIPPTGACGFGKQLFPMLVEKGLPVLGELIHGDWSDIGTLEDLFKANMNALTGKLQMDKEESAERESFPNIRIGKDVLIGKNVKIGEGATIGEMVLIGANCEVGAGASLENCLIFGESKVENGA
ncbi:MAG: NDP-sugar synthase, partial [Candidatus Obscuribacterales bacterium]|nr:NDP-sugar synthase [Candidatus Obscuribacterales bacterium]